MEPLTENQIKTISRFIVKNGGNIGNFMFNKMFGKDGALIDKPEPKSTQLTKDQISAVSEWMLTNGWGIFGLKEVMPEVANRFIEAFSPKVVNANTEHAKLDTSNIGSTTDVKFNKSLVERMCDEKEKEEREKFSKPPVYILQKDCLIAGVITGVIRSGEKVELKHPYYFSDSKFYFEQDFVENNPEWFIELIDIEKATYAIQSGKITPIQFMLMQPHWK